MSELIDKNRKAAISNAEKNELRAFGYSIQNRGFALEEKKHDYSNALIQIDRALLFWISINDTTNEANLRKYKGLLLGHLKRFDEGKQEIAKAIGLFRNLNKDRGVAVSQYDMSRVMDLEDRIDSALFYQIQATAFWNNKKDPSRIVVNNTHLIHLYSRLKDYEKALNVQKATELVLRTNEHWNPAINFYYVSFKLFDKIGDESGANLWKIRYLNTIEVLKTQGITIRSFYDKD